MISKYKGLSFYNAVISHNRSCNIKSIESIVGKATFFVNRGEGKAYRAAGATNVIECGTNICEARNKALETAFKLGLPCVQVSDDLKKIQRVFMVGQSRKVEDISYNSVVFMMVKLMVSKRAVYAGVSVTDNRLNYKGDDISTDKLIVNDLICVRPTTRMFDIPLKEDYDMSIRCLIEDGIVLRLNNILCRFPHRDNKGGANGYRTVSVEASATYNLKKKWGAFVKDHPTRIGQVSLNYKLIRQAREQLEKLKGR